VGEPSVHTEQLHAWLTRIRDGDKAAFDELLRAVSDRVERIARKMLRGFPAVRRWEDTQDVLQDALMRLLRSLGAVHPGSMREFFGLAATQIRRTLLDLARHYLGPHGHGANYASTPRLPDGREPLAEPPDPENVRELERWCEFHQAIENLPVDEREVVELLFYHGWTQAQVSELLQMSPRTVQRRWQSACLKLHDALHGQMPGI
jgi:RNA polymerase sigma factor (sigma-70 family)